MATSGSSNFDSTRDEIIEAAGFICGALRQNESMGDAMHRRFQHALNGMVKNWQASGIHVWTVAEGVLVPAVSQRAYQLAASGTDHAALASDFFQTELSASEAAGQTILSVDDPSDIAVSDNVGVVLDDGTVHWAVASAVGASTVTINGVGLADSAAAGNAVFSYTTKLVRPLKVVHARRYNYVSEQDTPLVIYGRTDYLDIPNKNSTGDINGIFYDKKARVGEMNLWQVPASITDLVHFTFWRPIEDFDSAGDNPDLPVEWVLAIEHNLALAMTSQYGVGPQRRAMIEADAARYLNPLVDGFDRDDESIQFAPDMSGR
jgi:hypothetical protein